MDDSDKNEFLEPNRNAIRMVNSHYGCFFMPGADEMDQDGDDECWVCPFFINVNEYPCIHNWICGDRILLCDIARYFPHGMYDRVLGVIQHKERALFRGLDFYCIRLAIIGYFELTLQDNRNIPLSLPSSLLLEYDDWDDIFNSFIETGRGSIDVPSIFNRYDDVRKGDLIDLAHVDDNFESFIVCVIKVRRNMRFSDRKMEECEVRTFPGAGKPRESGLMAKGSSGSENVVKFPDRSKDGEFDYDRFTRIEFQVRNYRRCSFHSGQEAS